MSQECDLITAEIENITSGFDAYALDFPACSGSALSIGHRERWRMRETVRRAHSHVISASVKPDSDGESYPYFPNNYQPCDSEWADEYLSRKDVQDAIHATPGGAAWTGNWSSCSDAVGNAYSVADTNKPMMPV